MDGRNNYNCDCDALWGGKNCSVKLTGCVEAPCKNDGLCVPYLEYESVHLFNCTCKSGFYGKTCEQISTMSLIDGSLITVKTAREEGYDIQLRFRTTLPNGILAFGTAFDSQQVSPNSYILELVNGRLNLHSSLLNKWEGVFIGSGLNDSQWHKVFVAINSSHLVLSANDEQTIYPINSYEGTNGSHTTFPVTYLGGYINNTGPFLRHLTNHVEPSNFIGCMEDIVINGQWVLPDQQDNRVSTKNIKTGCRREEQCIPNPCNSNGHCTDLWHTFKCACQRPHLGTTCKYSIIPATFGHENVTKSSVIVNVSDVARRAIRSILDISMFVRTRQQTGQIFYLGSDPNQSVGPTGEPPREPTSIAAKLSKGELEVHMRFNGTPETYAVGGKQLDDGYNHLIEIIRNSTLVQVKINGTEYFRKTLSSTGILNAQFLSLGGPPIVDTNEIDDKDYFKGIIQDVQVSNGSQTMIVQLYPLESEEDLALPSSFGKVSINNSSVLYGEVSDDLCRETPCEHEAVCRNTWNDFVCECTRGYKGKYCEGIQFCELHQCPGNATCIDLNYGFDCITNITFRGNEENALKYYLEPKPKEEDEEEEKSILEKTIEISYRTKSGGTLLYVEDEKDMYFEVAVYKDQVTIQWQFSDDLPTPHRFTAENLQHYDWQVLYIRVADNKLEAGFKGWETLDNQPAVMDAIDVKAFEKLFSGKNPIYLGGMDNMKTNAIVKGLNANGAFYKGCIGATRIGGILLPFFLQEELMAENVPKRAYYSLNSTRPDEGCVLCFEQDCKNGGVCQKPSEIYACECPVGYEKDDCSQNIDECLQSECKNNSTCIDDIGFYTCECLNGYEGKYCEHEINECESNPCHNGGNCTDLIADFRCECHEDYAGKTCDVLRLVRIIHANQDQFVKMDIVRFILISLNSAEFY
jgi:protein crumbs